MQTEKNPQTDEDSLEPPDKIKRLKRVLAYIQLALIVLVVWLVWHGVSAFR